MSAPDWPAMGLYYEWVGDKDVSEGECPRWDQLTEDDREGWRRVSAYVQRVVDYVESTP